MNSFYLLEGYLNNLRFIFAKNSDSLFPTNPRQIIGNPFIELMSVGSTNNYAMQQAQNGYNISGTTWFTYEQKAGKGQRQKQWMSETGKNILMSTLTDSSTFPLSKQFCFLAAVAVACAEFFETLSGAQTFVKWPNDIFCNDRKAGGILVENIVAGNSWQWAIIGTGININQVNFPPLPLQPISLKQISGKTYNIIDKAKELCSYIENWINKIETEDEKQVLAEYNRRLFKKGKRVRLKKDNMVFDAEILRVDSSGYLWVNRGIETSFYFGEVQWIF